MKTPIRLSLLCSLPIRRLTVSPLALASVLVATATLHAQTYTSSWAAFDCGVASSQSQGGAVAHRGLFASWACHPLQSANYTLQAAHPSLPISEPSGPAAPSPNLRISLVGTDIRVSWPASTSSTFILQQNPTPVNGSWVDVLGPYQSSGAEHFLLVPATERQRYYRLRTP